MYRQIADTVRRGVALGELRGGTRLPSVRSLAQQVGVDPGTVARAYRELEREGTTVSRRGGGSFVSQGVGKERLAEEQRNRLALVVNRAILEGLGLGFAVEDIESAFTLGLSDWRERRARGKAAFRRADEVRFMGSHDLAVELLQNHLGVLHPGLRFSTAFVGSLAGLAAVACGEADVAGSHLFDEDTGEFNAPFVSRLMPGRKVVLTNLMQRFQGLMVAPGNPKGIRDIHDLARPGVTFVNRQKGSGTRILLDSRLLRLGIEPSQISGYQREESTHMAVASLVAQGRADAGLGAQSAANVLGLDFMPLLKERYDLVSLAETWRRPALRKLKEAVASRSFRNMLSSMPGYDVGETGRMTTV